MMKNKILCRYTLFTRSTAEISQLASLQMQLMHLQWKSIKDCISKGKVYKIEPPAQMKNALFFIMIARIFNQLYLIHWICLWMLASSQALLSSRNNASKAVDYPKAQNMNSISAYLKELVPNSGLFMD